MKVLHVVSAVIWHEEKILMIQQPDERGLYWFIPGGVVEPAELLLDALKREVKEETGLTIDQHDALAFVTQVNASYENRQTLAFVFEITRFAGDLSPDDPDDLIHGAEFVPVTHAIDRLQRVLWASMRDPLISYLCQETAPGTIWHYHQRDFLDSELVSPV